MTTNPDLDHIATPLGHFLIEFNSLEVDMGRLISRLVDQNDDWIVAIFAGELMFNAKIKLASALVLAKVSPEIDQEPYEQALKRADNLNIIRNAYIHSEYLPFLDANDKVLEVLRASHRKRAKLYAAFGQGDEIDKILKPADPDELLSHIAEIYSLGLEIRRLAEQYYDRRPE